MPNKTLRGLLAFLLSAALPILAQTTGGGPSSGGGGGGAVNSVFNRTGTVTANSGDYGVGQVTGAAPLASPTFTGTPTAPTQAVSTNNNDIATTAAVQAAINALNFAPTNNAAFTGTFTVNGSAPLIPGGTSLLGDAPINNGAVITWGEGSGFYSSGGPTSFFGDSITAGVGCSTASNCYAALLANYFSVATDFGVSGTYSADMTNNQVFTNLNPNYNGQNISTILIGVNDANNDATSGGTTGLLANYYHTVMASVAQLGIPAQYKIQGQNVQTCSKTGTWTNVTIGTISALQSIVPGSTLSCTSLTSADSAVYGVWLAKNTYTSTATFSVDGTVVDTWNSFGYNGSTIGFNNASQTEFASRYALTGGGTHTYLVTVGTAGSGNPFTVLWMGSPAPTLAPTIFANPTAFASRIYLGGVIKQQTDALSATTAAYNAQAQSLANTMAADNIPVRFVNVRNYVNSTTDMAGSSGTLANGYPYPASSSPGLHPNDLGHQHLADSFLASIQPGTPVKTGNLTSNFTITPGTITSASGWSKFNGGNVYNSSPGNLNPGWTVYDNGSTSVGAVLLNFQSKPTMALYSAPTGLVAVCPGTTYPTSVSTWSCPFYWSATQAFSTKLQTSTVQDSALTTATSIASTSLTSTGIVLTAIPVNTAQHIHCALIWEQATAISTVQFGIGVSLAPTTTYVLNTVSNGNVTPQDQYTALGTSTTVTAVSAATAPTVINTGYRDVMDITVNTNGSNSPVVTLYAASGNASDAVLIEPGSYCALVL